MCIHPRAVRNPGRVLAARVASGLGALTMLATPGVAYAIACGDTLGPGGAAALADDLVCDASPALTIVGPFALNLNKFTISCTADDAIGIDVTGVGARVRDGTISDCAKGVVVEGGGRHELRRLTVTSPDVPKLQAGKTTTEGRTRS